MTREDGSIFPRRMLYGSNYTASMARHPNYSRRCDAIIAVAKGIIITSRFLSPTRILAQD